VTEGRLQPVLADHIMPGGTLYAVYPSARRVPVKVRVFVDLLVDHLLVNGWSREPRAQGISPRYETSRR
jgi:DNA-binding transcriptional LysR family regulator